MLFNTQPKFCSDFRIGATPKELLREFGKLSIGTHKRVIKTAALATRLVKGDRDKNHRVILTVYVKRVRVKQLEM